MDDASAVETLRRLGLTGYQARLLLALQKIETGTASEIADVSEVPRSQVYGVAESLKEDGLIEVQQTTPTRFRAVPLSTVREQLLTELEATGDRAFQYLSHVREQQRQADADDEGVWTVSGNEAVTARTVDLIEMAEGRLIYGTGTAEQLNSEIISALESVSSAGVAVVVVSDSERVLERATETDGIATETLSSDPTPGVGRLLLVDRDALLLSIVDTDYLPEDDEETAIWGEDTAFAAVLVTILEQWLETNVSLPSL